MLPRQVEQRLLAEPEVDVDVDVDANEGPQPERRKKHYLYSGRRGPQARGQLSKFFLGL